MSAVPIKRISDTQMPFTETTRPDLNPHLSALATGGFSIGYDDAFSATDVNAVGRQFGPDGIVSGPTTASFSNTSNETQQGSYGLASGNLVVAWTDTPMATGSNSDIKAVIVNPEFGFTGTPFVVNAFDTTGNQVRPEVVELSSGNLAFAWIDTSSSQIKAEVLDTFGDHFSPVAIVSTTPSSQDSGSFDLGMTR